MCPEEQKSHLYEDIITKNINQDILNWKKELNLLNIRNEYKNLHKPIFIYGSFLFLLDWCIIFIVFYICCIMPILIPIMLILAGSKQRALSNLIHDSSHWNLSRNKKLNDFVTDLLGGYPMVSPVTLYRATHLLHHRHLGHPTLDPDSVMHQRYDYNDLMPPYQSWFSNVIYLLFNLKSWKDSLFGSWNELPFKQKLSCCIWWFSFICLFSFFSSKYALLFTLFWISSRATGFHFVRTIAEFLDHSGLPVGSISKNSRVIINSGWLTKKIFHPHNDIFHALHHFDPSLPNYNLNKAHFLIGNKIKSYNLIKKNDGYLIGKNAALKDLVGSL